VKSDNLALRLERVVYSHQSVRWVASTAILVGLGAALYRLVRR
jgi:hypothetical protein